MQASSLWTPPTGTLGDILNDAKARVAELRLLARDLEEQASQATVGPSFRAALLTSRVGVIAEVKRRSPSKGWINSSITAPEQALAYQIGGAAAISVLTEPKYFGGSAYDLVDVRGLVTIPVLKKDFHIDPIQLLESKAIGASAALLIARALSPDDLPKMMEYARQIELEVLVEIRDSDELKRALDAGASIIGINNRNLETLDIDPANAERLLSRIPPNVVAIAESGMNGRDDVARYAAAGADAVLVGSVVSAASDPVAKVRELAGVARVGRG